MKVDLSPTHLRELADGLASPKGANASEVVIALRAFAELAGRHASVETDGEQARRLELTTLLSARTKRGLIELTLGHETAHLEVAKAKHVANMLHEAIEAAISDEVTLRFLTERIGLSERDATIALSDYREMRQGSRETVNPS